MPLVGIIFSILLCTFAGFVCGFILSRHLDKIHRNLF